MANDSIHPPLPPPTRVHLATLPEHDCPYLPGRLATSRAFFASTLSPELYHRYMDAGFRRSGRVVYQPTCPTCRACVPIRVPVDRFVPSKSQRRCWRKNQDLRVTVAEPEPTHEKYELYRRYETQWHGKRPQDESAESFVSFLYDSPVRTLEFCYRDPAGKLLAVGICDVSPGQSLSAVYLYHDPEAHRRGVGTFSALYEIEYANAQRIPYWYLGYWVDGCATMAYKATFHPHELLGPDGLWHE